jgi:hypothetical protein
MTNTEIKNADTNHLLAVAQISRPEEAWEMLLEVETRTGYVRTWDVSFFEKLHPGMSAARLLGCACGALRTELKRHIGAQRPSQSFYFHGAV